jgi:hypothetical protein
MSVVGANPGRHLLRLSSSEFVPYRKMALQFRLLLLPSKMTRYGKFVTERAYYASPADALSSGSMSDFAENGFLRYARHPD